MVRVLFVFLLCPFLLNAQTVVISSYYNAADQRDEWIELLVTGDNVDMRGWSLRDNNATQTNWQIAVNFNTVDFWNNMRVGTVIMLWNRMVASDGLTSHAHDHDKRDGYVELNVQDATYFNGGFFGSSPVWGGSTLDVAGSEDLVQLRDASGNHVHALGHGVSLGVDWTNLPSPKLNHHAVVASGEVIHVSEGDSLALYGVSAPLDGSLWTGKSGTPSFGLPNSASNSTFWGKLREPSMTMQEYYPTLGIGSLNFSWVGCTDVLPADSTTGYVVLRNNINDFTPPNDGFVYANGAALGGASVLTHLSSSTNTYTDHAVLDGDEYYYRVYSYRYVADGTYGNAASASRGRAYNTDQYVSINHPIPLSSSGIRLFATLLANRVKLEWQSHESATFAVERSDGHSDFVEIGRLNSGSNNVEWCFYDANPLFGDAYYRLKCFLPNGQFFYSDLVHVMLCEIENAFCLFKDEEAFWCFKMPCEEESVCWKVLDMNGGTLVDKCAPCVATQDIHRIMDKVLPQGVYSLVIRQGNVEMTRKISQ
jgi:hypothetical protein